MTKNIDYNSLNKELQEILDELDTNESNIDEAIAQYGRGMEIINQLETYLKEAENKVQKVKQQWDNTGA